MEATPTLDAAVTMARQSEAVKKQQSVVQGETNPVALEAEVRAELTSTITRRRGRETRLQ